MSLSDIYTDGDIDRGQLILGLETALKQLRELEAAAQYSTLCYGAVQRYNTRNKCNSISGCTDNSLVLQTFVPVISVT